MRLFFGRAWLFICVLRLHHRLIRMLRLMRRLGLMRMLGLMIVRLLRLGLRLVGVLAIFAALVLAVAVSVGTVRLATAVTGEGILVRELSISASEKGGALGNHFVAKRELLAVEDEGVLVIVEVRRGKAAQVARCVDLGGRVVECGHVAGLVHVGRLVAGTDHRVASRDPRVERGGVIAQVPDGRLEGLKSDENLGLHLDSLHIVVLVPDLLVLPELVDLLVEISAG